MTNPVHTLIPTRADSRRRFREERMTLLRSQLENQRHRRSELDRMLKDTLGAIQQLKRDQYVDDVTPHEAPEEPGVQEWNDDQ